jgi:hypothetical protein
MQPKQGLADPAWTEQRQQPDLGRREELAGGRQLGFPPDRVDERRRQLGGR